MTDDDLLFTRDVSEFSFQIWTSVGFGRIYVLKSGWSRSRMWEIVKYLGVYCICVIIGVLQSKSGDTVLT